MTQVLSPAAARRNFLLLSITRCFPSGLVVAVITLWFLDRGLTISEALLAFSVVAPLLGVLADAVNTQTAMVTAGAFSVLGALLYLPALRAEKQRGRTDAEPSVVSGA